MTPPAKLPAAVLLDWDNTLVDSWPMIYQALRETFVAMKRQPWTLEETKQRVHLSLRDSFPALFGEEWERAMQLYYDAFEQQHLDRLTPLPGAERLLKDLHAKGIYLGLVSNKTGRYLRIEVEHLGWHRYFTRTVGAGDAARDKPAKDGVLMALDGSNISPGIAVWFAGDSPADMEIAHNAGCYPVLIRKNPPEFDEFSRFPPAWHTPGCSELAAYIDGL